MRKSRFITTASLVLAGGIVLSSCTSNTPEPAPVDEAVEGAITYSFWGTPARAEKVAAVVELFEGEYPDVTMTTEVADYTAHFERMVVRAAANDLACATAMQDRQVTDYAQSGVFLDLGPLIESGQIDTSNIPEQSLAAGQIDGVQFMLPTGNFVLTMGYDEAVVEAAGVDAPTSDMTWEDYADWALEIQPELPAGVYATENSGHLYNIFQSYVMSQGQEFYDEDGLAFDKSVLADWFEYWLELADAGATNPASMIAEQYLAMELQPMAQGKAVTGVREIANLLVTEKSLVGLGRDTQVIQFSIPSADDDSASNVQGANGIAIPASCDNVATAAAFLDFFTNDVEAGLAFGSHNATVTNTKVQEAFLESDEAPAEIKEIIEIFRSLTADNDVMNVPTPVGANSLTAEFRRIYEAVAFGELSVKDGVDQFFTSVESALR